MPSLYYHLDNFFQLSDRDTDVGTELRAGFISFLSCAYLLPLIPLIFSLHVPPDLPLHSLHRLSFRVSCGVALSSSIATFLSGILTNYPIILTPGLGLTTFFTSLLASSSLPHSLACASLSGLLLFLISFLSVDRVARTLIPDSIKLGAMSGLGLFVALAGLKMCGVVQLNDSSGMYEIGELRFEQGLAVGGFLGVALLLYHRVKGSMLIGVIVVTVVYDTTVGFPPLPAFQWPDLRLMQDIGPAALLPLTSSIPAILSFFLIALFDLTAVIHAIASLAPLDQTKESRVFLVSGLSSVVAAFFSCPPLIVAVESVVGLKEGGRTGLTAITASLLFALSLFAAPLFTLVPAVSTSPLLILIGSFLFSEVARIPLGDPLFSIPAFITIVLVPFTSSIAIGIVGGLIAYVLLGVGSGEWNSMWPLVCCWDERGEADEHTRLMRDSHRDPLYVRAEGEAEEEYTEIVEQVL